MSVTKPTVGRKLWLFIDPSAPRRSVVADVRIIDPDQPLDASIAYVFPARPDADFDLITISFADHAGVVRWHTVPLRQVGQPKPDAREWCEWPQFQKEQGATASPTASSQQDAVDEALIQGKGATRAPRLTPANIDAVIVGETFTVLPSQRVTVCELTLLNGFTVRGESAVVSIENFDATIGQKVARDNARSKVWELEGYLLKERLHQAAQRSA
jgi:hypothetical protein